MENARLIDGEFVNTFIRKRDRRLHKGDCGKVLVVAGKKGMAGAAILCARGALRAGAGLVRVSLDEELFPIIQTGIPEATCVSRELPPESLKEYQAIIIGPGLGVEDSNVKLIKDIFDNLPDIPVVLDADGLNLLAVHGDLTASFSGSLILTPHPGEAARLLGWETGEVQEDRAAAVRRIAEKYRAVTVLKGAGTLVAVPEGPTYTNTTGNPGMATGGSGDVLSGIIGALCGQGLPPLGAAASGVYLHGLAGDIAAEGLGEHGLIASDIANMTSLAIRRTLNNPGKEVETT